MVKISRDTSIVVRRVLDAAEGEQPRGAYYPLFLWDLATIDVLLCCIHIYVEDKRPKAHDDRSYLTTFLVGQHDENSLLTE